MPSIVKDFESRAEAFIGTGRLLHTGAPVLVALSGGADSVALLALLTRLGYEIGRASCRERV